MHVPLPCRRQARQARARSAALPPALACTFRYAAACRFAFRYVTVVPIRSMMRNSYVHLTVCAQPTTAGLEAAQGPRRGHNTERSQDHGYGLILMRLPPSRNPSRPCHQRGPFRLRRAMPSRRLILLSCRTTTTTALTSIRRTRAKGHANRRPSHLLSGCARNQDPLNDTAIRNARAARTDATTRMTVKNQATANVWTAKRSHPARSGRGGLRWHHTRMMGSLMLMMRDSKMSI